MSEIEISVEPETLTITSTAEFEVPVQRLWDAYADPRQLERFWGPPGWPAQFTSFDHRVGGLVQYRMHGPDGEVSAGRWEFTEIDEPRGFAVLDAFADEVGEPVPGMPQMPMEFTFEEVEDGSRVVCVAHLESKEAMDQVVEMGVVEGTRAAMSQIGGVLARSSAG